MAIGLCAAAGSLSACGVNVHSAAVRGVGYVRIDEAVKRDPLYSQLSQLDDAMAAVDPETEDLIRRGMNHVMRDRTTFLIAHRISTVKRADVVIVLERGRVTQMGTHDELLAAKGLYSRLHDLQHADSSVLT